MQNFDKSVIDLKDELFKLREENTTLKEFNLVSAEHKDFEIKKLKDLNDKLASQSAHFEQQYRLMKKEMHKFKIQMINYENEINNNQETMQALFKEREYAGGKNSQSISQTPELSIDFTKNPAYSSLKSKEYRFNKS